MKTDPRVLINYLHVNCVRNIAIHRGITEFSNTPAFAMNTWRVLSNSAIDMAIIEWCSLFGTYGENNSTHWLNCECKWIDDRSMFIADVLSPVDVSFDDWQSYHNKLVTYRNKNVAHLDVDDWRRDVPKLEIALSVLFRSYEIFIKDVDLAKKLQVEYDRAYKEACSVVEAALKKC